MSESTSNKRSPGPKRPVGRILGWAVLGLIVLAIGWAVAERIGALTGDETGGRGGRGEAGPAPVEVKAVEHGPIVSRRTFSGTLESHASFLVSPKVGGRIERIAVDVSDVVKRNQVVAELDSAEYEQAVAQAAAELAVTKANLSDARSSMELAKRELNRIKTLEGGGIASEAQLDVAEADALAKSVAVEVAQAQVTRAEAALAAAKIRRGYTQVTASWSGDDPERVVAERFAEEGDTVAANAPLLTIVELDPIDAVIFVTEKDYARLRTNQTVTLTTDAHPGETFTGSIARISPVFQRTSRQARVEISVDNPDRKLSPGMFIRAEVVLERVEDATIIPASALVKRDQQTGVFLVNESGDAVTWRTVDIGIRDGARVQVLGEGIEGRVVTLGQQLISDGSAITIPEEQGAGEAGSAVTDRGNGAKGEAG